MKFTLTFKDPDMNIGGLSDFMYDKTGMDYFDFICQWTDGEYVTIQFDTEAGTATVLKEGEPGVNEHHEKLDIVGKVKLPSNEIGELKRQLDEALESLAKEEDKSTPYAQSLLKFIMETRGAIRFHEDSSYDNL
jgi:hypothetical protein